MHVRSASLDPLANRRPFQFHDKFVRKLQWIDEQVVGLAVCIMHNWGKALG